MPAAYQFVDEWFVPASVEDVYDVIGENSPTRPGGARSSPRSKATAGRRDQGGVRR
jgi:hypothetical protein